MRHIYINITITYWSNHALTPTCRYYEKVDDEEAEFYEISFEKARRLQWELILAGAEHKFSTNPLRNTIHEVNTTFFTRH